MLQVICFKTSSAAEFTDSIRKVYRVENRNEVDNELNTTAIRTYDDDGISDILALWLRVI